MSPLLWRALVLAQGAEPRACGGSEAELSVRGLLSELAWNAARDVHVWAVLALAALALVAMQWVGRRRVTPPLAPPAPPNGRPSPSPTPPGVFTPGPAERLVAGFRQWLAEQDEGADLWPPFEQFIRESLNHLLGAAHIRCFHVRPDAETLAPLVGGAGAGGAPLPSARAGLLGHVVTTGRPYAVGDVRQGPLVAELAAQAADRWAWVWPVCSEGRTRGVIAVGGGAGVGAFSAAAQEALGPALSLCWDCVAARVALAEAQRKDRATGVLNRADFFAQAGRALAESYALGEPLVVVTLTLEGLRRLDDARRWRERDALVERTGRVLVERVRRDDVVGRFADDRFVLVLRRLDSALGRLIAGKLLQAIGETAAALDGVRVRAGLAGSGLARPELDALLATAFAAADRARQSGVALAGDLPVSEQEGAA